MNNIGYCDRTVNTMTGCTLELECKDRCWARRMARRLSANPQLKCRHKYENFLPAWHPERLKQLQGQGEIIAVNFMGDMWGPGHNLHRKTSTLEVMLAQPQQQYLMLTKYPENILTAARLSRSVWLALQASNIWWGVSISRQADCERLNLLTSDSMPDAARLWVSVEPMLEAIDLAPWLHKLSWVVCGAEKGPKHRTFQYLWADQLWKQTKAAGKPFWFKGPVGEKNWPEGMRK